LYTDFMEESLTFFEDVSILVSHMYLKSS